MFTLLISIVLIGIWRAADACEAYHDPACIVTQPLDGKHFLNQWIVNIDGGEEMARNVARQVGFDYLKPMNKHEDHFIFKHPEVPHRHKMRNKEILELLRAHKKIQASDQHYVFELTLDEIEHFEDMVGHSEPLDVKVSSFNPDEVEVEHTEKPFDVLFEDPPLEVRAIKDELNAQQLPPLEKIFDFDAAYEKKRKMKAAYLAEHPELES